MDRLFNLFSRGVLERPAFLVHTAELSNHFEPIWEALFPQAFDILLYGDTVLPDHLPRDTWNVRVRSIDDALKAKDRYDVLVSNHPVRLPKTSRNKRKAMIKRLARTNLRMMYAAGKSGWNMSDWNRLYDGVLCFGPHHAKAFSDAFGLPVAQMGYPRFDKYFTDTSDQSELHKRFNCDPGKPTVVWLPTWKDLSSVDHFNDEVAALLPRFNVVVKVHPLMPQDEPKRVHALKQIAFNALITNTMDNVPLYRLADFMLFDYGGPAFGAIYTGKRFILLNVPGAAQDALAGQDSPDVLLRQRLINVDPDSGLLFGHLQDGPHWDTHMTEIASLRSAFFVDNFGTSAKAAADAILDRSWLHRKGTPAW